MALRIAKLRVKRALRSRYLFDNWLLLLAKYALIKLGLNVKLEAKIKGYSFKLSSDVLVWFVSRFSHCLIRHVDCVNNTLIMDNVRVKLVSDAVYDVKAFAKSLGWRYDASRDCWIKGDAMFKRIYMPVIDIFDFGAYDELEFRDKVIVDVGAFVGDSAIYFALRGAKKVIAVEPHPEAFKEMLENIRLNGLEDVVVPINAGLASRPGSIHVKKVDLTQADGMYHRPSRCGEIPAVTLGELIDKYDLSSDAVLKLDCEGCEYDVILNDYEHIKVFDELIVEYHAGHVGIPVSKLLKILSKDYRCKIVKGDKEFGIVHCTKK